MTVMAVPGERTKDLRLSESFNATTTGRTPAEMLKGRRPKSILDLLRPDRKKEAGKTERKT